MACPPNKATFEQQLFRIAKKLLTQIYKEKYRYPTLSAVSLKSLSVSFIE